MAAGEVPLLSDAMHAELRRYSAPQNADLIAMDSKGQRAQQSSGNVYCQGIARTQLPPMEVAARPAGAVETPAEATGAATAAGQTTPPRLSSTPRHLPAVGYGHGGDTLGFRCKLLWVGGPSDRNNDGSRGGSEGAPCGDGSGGGDGSSGSVGVGNEACHDGFVLAAMTNIGTMHCGLSPSPFDLWVEHILLPAVREAAPLL